MKKINLDLTHSMTDGYCLDLFKFGQSCGQKLEFIRIKTRFKKIGLNELLLLTPNLKIIHLPESNELSPFSEIFLHKLQEIHFKFKSLDDLKTFSDKYHKQIKKMRITFSLYSSDK